MWNKAAVGKYIWAITTKKDSLFVKWVNVVYLKEGGWWEYECRTDCSWFWKKLVAVKNELKQKINLEEFSRAVYSIKFGCSILGAEANREKVSWCKQVWDKMVIPKHRFINWLVMHNRLHTKARLWQLGVVPDQICWLCGKEDETVEHLFFKCIYSEACIAGIRKKLGWQSKGSTMIEVMRWVKNAKLSKLQKRIMHNIIAALIYHLWRVRNDAVWLGKVWIVDNTIQRIATCILPKKATKLERDLVDNMCAN